MNRCSPERNVFAVCDGRYYPSTLWRCITNNNWIPPPVAGTGPRPVHSLCMYGRKGSGRRLMESRPEGASHAFNSQRSGLTDVRFLGGHKGSFKAATSSSLFFTLATRRSGVSGNINTSQHRNLQAGRFISPPGPSLPLFALVST